MNIFGTDGIRGSVNQYPINCETALKIGRALADHFGRFEYNKPILIGRDTRISSKMIVNAIASGICSMGIDSKIVGVIPTPGIAYLTSKGNYCAGLVVSASHNKFYDNGIKIFNTKGFKISHNDEKKLENKIKDKNLQNKTKSVRCIGKINKCKDKLKKYINFLKYSNSKFYSTLKNTKIVIDCSNGATSNIASSIFSSMGAEVISLFSSPNGININDNCGSEHPKKIAKIVVNEKADIGLAFDGDGDRLVAISELGEILDGDQLIAIFAKYFKSQNILKNNTVVSNIMSNSGLKIALEKMGIIHITSEVGDKHVINEMIKNNSILGGEKSGHIILANHQNTGDGISTGISLTNIIKKYNIPLSKMSNIIKKTPQYSIDINIKYKLNLLKIPEIKNAISKIKKNTHNKSRIIVRNSGTQPKCRIMIEGNESKKIKKYCKYIANIIKKKAN